MPCFLSKRSKAFLTNELSIRRNYFDNKVYEEECDALLEERRQAIETVPHVDIQADLDLIHTKLSKGLVGTRPSYETFRPSDSKKISKDKLLGKPDYEIERIIVNNTIPFKLKQVTGIDNDRLEIGTAVHSLFETIIKDEEAVLGLIRKIDKDQLLEELDAETLTRLCESFKKTSLYARIKASPQAYTEIPFSYKIGAGNNFENETLHKDTYVNGYIDLIFKEDNGWVIVDYKTCKKTDTKYTLWQSYILQLDNYKEIWEKVSGEQVIGQEILFIEKEVTAE